MNILTPCGSSEFDANPILFDLVLKTIFQDLLRVCHHYVSRSVL